MQDRQADRVTSPPKSARVEDGKIRKIRSATRSDSTAIQHFNGKTYACESCKRGHRVQKCDHGRTRPISETNQPGRPSGGQKRGCRCPRNCACTTKTCKCERDCACTQEMYLIVRVDGPQTIKREATSTPRPVWEDDKGNTLTLKRVWADANGRQIDDEEYQKRRQRMKEREEGISKTPEVSKSSCCSSKKAKEEEQPADGTSKTTSGGCRHRENVAVSQPSIERQPSALTPQSNSMSNDSWVAACSCGSGCSCLYCPDHPNNATSIKHTQQQVKNLAEQAFVGDGLMPASFVPESTPQSCMGGRPTFFLSKTPGMSQQQLAQFFSENSEPGAIYLTYPIQQHSWTNQPASAHCSHVQSPSGTGAVATPDPTEPFAESLEDMPTVPAAWDLLPDDPSGTWNFSDGQLGNTSFSWTDLDASYGTDYSIGQATVASMTGQNSNPGPLPNTPFHHFPTPSPNMDALASHTPLADFSTVNPGDFGGCCGHSALQDEYPNFDMSATPGPVHEQMHRPGSAVIPGFAPHQSYTMQTPVNPPSTMPPLLDRQPQLFHPALLPQQLDVVPVSNTNGDLKLWNGYDPLVDEPLRTEFKSLPIPNSPPIANGA
ncbi:hypothetical protein ABEF91_000303 [Exophiala dermatitidis]